jgi:tetratricopeptide (TPR) repeat protein
MARPKHPWLAGLVVLLFCSTALATYTEQEISRASKLHRKGVQAMQSGNLEKARESFDKALQSVSVFPDAHIGLGQIAMAEKEFERALVHFEQARDGYAELGASLLDIRMKRYASAQSQIASLDDQIRHLESTTSAQTRGGTAAGGQNAITIGKMRNLQQQLLAIEPPNPDEATEPPGEIFFYIGNALFQLNRPDDALGAWETCRERSPKFAMVYNNLALIYMQTGRLEEAKKSLIKAEELGFPVNPQFKLELERALINSGEPESG